MLLIITLNVLFVLAVLAGVIGLLVHSIWTARATGSPPPPLRRRPAPAPAPASTRSHASRELSPAPAR